MRSVKEFKKMAPFTADELVHAAQSLLPSHYGTPFSKRTLRFYIARNVVSRPLGSPKFARYGYEHLLQLMATRMYQDQGLKLESVSEELQELVGNRLQALEDQVENWLGRQRVDRYVVRERAAMYDANPNPSRGTVPGEVEVRRIRLTDEITLELPAREDLHAQLETASEKIKALLNSNAARASGS